MHWLFHKRNVALGVVALGAVALAALSPLASRASLELGPAPGPGQQDDPFVFEAETVNARVSSSRGGAGKELNLRALPLYDPGARNGFILGNANAGGPSNYVSYAINGAKAGKYVLWARLRGDRVAAEVRLNKQVIASALPASAASGFGWVEVGTADLSQNNTLDLSIRGQSAIDAFALTAQGSADMTEALDATVRDHAFERRYPADVLARARAYDPPITPDWASAVGNEKLPDWFDRARVQVHTRLKGSGTTLPLKDPAFLRMGADMAGMGVRAYTRHIKSGDEGAWWPTRFGAEQALTKSTRRDFAREILDDSLRSKVPMIVYERHMEDADYAASHPDTITRNPAGAPFFRRGTMLSLLDPAYIDRLIGRSDELIDRGAKGFYLDEDHMPLYGDWSPVTLAAFKKDTDLPAPADYDIHDPVYLAFLRWYPQAMGAALTRFAQAMRKRDPDNAILLSANRWPALSIGHYSGAELRAFTSIKTEFAVSGKPHNDGIFAAPADFPATDERLRVMFGWVLSRDAADGRPAHVWIDRTPAPDWGKLYPAAAVIAQGCIANLDMSEAKIPDTSFEPAITMGNTASDALRGTRPFRHVGFLLSDTARFRYAGDNRAMWMHASGIVRYGWDAAKQAQIPAGFLTEAQLLDTGYMQRAQFRVIVAPAPADLPAPIVAELDKLRAAGVLVVNNRPEWDWSTKAGSAAAQAALMQIVAKTAPSPVQVVTGQNNAVASDFFIAADGARIATVTNNVSWLLPAMMQPRKKANGGNGPDKVAFRQPGAASGVTLRWRLSGSPRSVTEAVSGKTLKFTYDRGVLQVPIPQFQYLAVVVLR